MTGINISLDEKKEDKQYDISGLMENKFDELAKKLNKKEDNKKEEKPISVPEATEFMKVEQERNQLKESNDRLQEEIERREDLKARLMIGGRAEAGQKVVEKTSQEIAAEEAKRILSEIR